MLRKLSFWCLISIFLLLVVASVSALTSKLSLDKVTRQDMIINGSADKPNIDIVVVDKKTNETIGKAVLKADQNGMFSTHVAFDYLLSDHNDILIRVEDTADNDDKKTTTEYNIFIDCFFVEQQTKPSEDDPCGWKVYSVRVVGDGMG